MSEHTGWVADAAYRAGYKDGQDDSRADALREAVARIRTHNGTDVTATNLRYAATHAALNPSWIFDVLMALADVLDTRDIPPGESLAIEGLTEQEADDFMAALADARPRVTPPEET